MIFIGDIAGRYEELMRLLDKLPKDRKILFVGDLCDRGQDSKKVIELVMSDSRMESLYGNHEDMFVDWYDNTFLYEENLWVHYNGGDATLRSYGAINMHMHYDDIKALIPKDHIDWLKARPLFQEGEDWIATHAPINPSMPFERFLHIHENASPWTDIFEYSVIWNRGTPRRTDKFQIHGHNSRINFYEDKQGEYGVCIDNCHNGYMTAYLWPEKKFVHEELIGKIPAKNPEAW